MKFILLICIILYIVNNNLVNGLSRGDVLDSIDASKTAKSIRDDIPRFGYNKTFDPDNIGCGRDDNSNIQGCTDYVMGIGFLGIVGIIFALVSLLTLIIYLVLKCCGKCKEKDSYTPGQLKCSLITMVVLGTFIAFTAAFGLWYNDGIRSDMTGDEGLTKTALLVVSNTTEYLTDVQKPIDELLASIPPALKNVTVLLNETSVLANRTVELVDRLDTFEQDHVQNQSISETVGGHTVDIACTFCPYLSTKVQDTRNQIANKTTPVLDDVKESVKSIEDSLIKKRDSINQKLGDTRQSIINVRSNITDQESFLRDAESSIIEYDNWRHKGTWVVLALPLLGCALALAGLLCRSKKMFVIYGVIVFISCFILWILLAVHLPAAVLFGDACGYMDQEEAYMLQNPNSSDYAKTFSTCVNDESLVDAFNLTGDLNFSESIVYPEFDNQTRESFEFSTLDDLVNETNRLSFDNFTDYDPNVVPSQLGIINSNTAPPYPYDRDNYTLAPGHDNEKDIIGATIAAENRMNETIINMQTELRSIDVFADTLKDDVSFVDNAINTINATNAPLIQKADTLRDESHCLFVSDAYYGMKGVLCGRMISSLTTIALMFFLTALFGTISVAVSICLKTRLFKKKRGHDPIDLDDEAYRRAEEDNAEMQNDYITATIQHHMSDSSTDSESDDY